MPAAVVPNVQMTKAMKFTLTANPILSTSGDPAPLASGSVPTWSSDVNGVVTLVPAADGMSCDVLGLGAGNATITCSAMGQDTITATATVTVTDVQNTPVLADELVLTATAPVAQ